eukprot:CAMPEP_0206142888 /NCGR_PEP_ID=MMETSP1473-20131121/18556_1 /ASSEMBLY_ACC=CAM_ASM_001109 /TAXON_ID=1461547 /ORGANISM="Stichococcus sp, Strain RCC1054" /LENGTH=85 /DNA_ID=CAMNT_0053538053 /DNA_START=138 /DNA_END=392 /DNA_ORIENTATION=-
MALPHTKHTVQPEPLHGVSLRAWRRLPYWDSDAHIPDTVRDIDSWQVPTTGKTRDNHNWVKTCPEEGAKGGDKSYLSVLRRMSKQ